MRLDPATGARRRRGTIWAFRSRAPRSRRPAPRTDRAGRRASIRERKGDGRDVCAIAGKVIRTGASADAEAAVRAMCRAMAHRGPDGEGVIRRGPAVLGHRRLAIIDLSPAAAQPMGLPDGSLWVVFNGEIYNFRELRRELETRGHAFRSRSDTEVILHAYREYGEDCVSRLRGMFAFAVWDEHRHRLFAARDRLGKKPFFYRIDEQGFTFASEAQGLAADPLGPPLEPDLSALDLYLTYGYVPHPWSAFRGVRKLSPAHVLVYDASGGGLREERYWRARREPKLRLPERDAEEEALRRLREAVRLRLASDVPLGAFLSGGVDSSLVVALMAEQGPVRTFSIGFHEAEYDERRYARAVAERYATRHTEFVVEPDAAEVLPRLVRHYGEPFADSSAVPSYYLARMTREHVTVALNGDGGDEAFGGYERYAGAGLAERLDVLPAPVLTAAAWLVRRLDRRPKKSGVLHRAARFLEAMRQDPIARYAMWVGYFDDGEKAALYSDDLARATEGVPSLGWLRQTYAGTDATDFIDRTMAADLETYLPGDLLVKMDIATMANSLEARSPLLDHELVEFAARLPVDYKVRGLRTKRLLKRIARRFVPREVVDRPKMGFGVPIDRWLRCQLRDLVEDCLFGRRAVARGYFRPAFVRRLVDEHASGRRRHHHLIWALLMLELWHREFIDGPRASRPAVAGPAEISA
ncbi:MAG TPA: asparagine synthase (glutamine-hydrolyzing) [Vicinamibacterales bacterium]|nr:asparagine synthase (glutamine-hydrolyzing) [Vicinamibacterales bacterium]